MAKQDPLKEARQAHRQGQTLKDSLVSPKMRHRYSAAVRALLQFWALHQCAPRVMDEVDAAVAVFLEHVFSEGEHKSLSNDTLAGLQFFMPSVRKRLYHSWKLCKVWHRLEPPQRAVPISPQLLAGLAGLAWAGGHQEIGAALLIGFDAMLRTGELIQLRMNHISFIKNRAILSLPSTKTSKRSGNQEMVVVESLLANKALQQVVSRRPGGLLLPSGAAHFRRIFRGLCQAFDLDFHVTPYSLRRGGATYSFLRHGSMERCLLRGRWASSSSARVYLADAVATVRFLQLSHQQLDLAYAAVESLKKVLGL